MCYYILDIVVRERTKCFNWVQVSLAISYEGQVDREKWQNIVDRGLREWKFLSFDSLLLKLVFIINSMQVMAFISVGGVGVNHIVNIS